MSKGGDHHDSKPDFKFGDRVIHVGERQKKAGRCERLSVRLSFGGSHLKVEPLAVLSHMLQAGGWGGVLMTKG